jgi:ABC-type amino acid transport system permease subunit
MPIIKTFSVVFIEFWRGVPLITVLFMSVGDAAAVPPEPGNNSTSSCAR